VLAYGGVPVAASLVLWALTAFIVGEAAIIDTPVATPGADVDGFVAFVLRLQFAVYILLLLWSVVLQVMGFSERSHHAQGFWGLGARSILGAAGSLLPQHTDRTPIPGHRAECTALTLELRAYLIRPAARV
jgi:hypothetical protein